LYNLLILANEFADDHSLWIKACNNLPSEVSYRVVDLISASWFEEISKAPFDYILAKPGGTVDSFKLLYDERLRILVEVLGHKVYPSLAEVMIYENKRYLSFWLSALNIPHPRTSIFYLKKEAQEFAATTKYPIVAKLNIGASGNGVSILRDEESCAQYVHKMFQEGIGSRTGPRMEKGSLFKRAAYMLVHPKQLKARLDKYKTVASNPQRGFCIFQEFIPHTFEWRVVRIGDSFFAHKKIVKGEKASGSLIKGYENPPFKLLNFAKEITDKANFRSMALDIFETEDGRYLVNEMQCIFGQSDPYQMLVKDKPGRYIWINEEWVFEEGMFNTNESYDLRLEFVISQLSGQK
jgi:glutathione synthase/RimK-type ligase-like ATP-grasp enzyme